MSKTVEKLNLYLANLNVLYRKVQNYHWNIVGAGFFSVHEKLEEYYDAINEQIDDVAERILSIGGRPLGTLKDYLAVTTIKEAENKEISIPEAVADVKKEFEAMLKLVKEVFMDVKCILKIIIIIKNLYKVIKITYYIYLEKICKKIFSFLFTKYIKNVIINY